MSTMSGPLPKERRSIEDVRVFQKYWTQKFCVIEKDHKSLSIFCLETVVCRTSFVKKAL